MGAASPKNYFKTKKRYLQIGHLGRGGMAVVSESKDQYFQRTIAYKQLKDGPNLERKTEEFVREAMFMGMLEHPGILPIHELIVSPEEPSAITMDKVCGLSMAQKISQAKKDPSTWPFESRMRDFQKLVEIVAYAHSRKVIHRDIKPANVMFGERGEILLLDWGLAKFRLSVDYELTQGLDQRILDSAQSINGSIKGTPYYMSPEAAQGKAHIVNESSDTFGLGALLYELIALDYFIPGTKAIEVLKSAAQGKHQKIDKASLLKASSYHKKCNAELVYVLQKSVEIDMNDRYQHASQMNEDMISYLNDLSMSGLGRPWSAYQIKKWFKKNYTWIIFIVMPILGIAEMLNFFESKNNEIEKEISEIEGKIKKDDQNLSRLNKNILDKENEYERILKKNDELKEENNKWNNEEKNTLIDQNDELSDEINEYVKDNETLKLVVEEMSNERNDLYDEYTTVRLIKDELKEDFSKNESLIRTSHFMEHTFLYGLELEKVRKAFEYGRREDALFLLRNSNLLTKDIFIVENWIEPFYGSTVKKGDNINKKFYISQKKGLLLRPQKESSKMLKVEAKFKSKTWKYVFEHPKLEKDWFISEEGLLAVFEKGIYKSLKLERGDVDLMLLESDTGSVVFRYEKKRTTKDERFVVVEKSLNHPIYIETSKKISGWSLDKDQLYLKSGGDDVRAYPKKISQKWASLKHDDIEDVESNDSSENDESTELPKGYTLLAESDTIQLIQFLSHDKSKFRNYDPYTGELIGDPWSINQATGFYDSIEENGQYGWWLLTESGDVILLHGDGEVIKVRSNEEDFIRQIFTIKDKNMAILQSKSGVISVYLLNTGQYLFSPGSLNDQIQDIVVDGKEQILFKTNEGLKVLRF